MGDHYSDFYEVEEDRRREYRLLEQARKEALLQKEIAPYKAKYEVLLASPAGWFSVADLKVLLNLVLPRQGNEVERLYDKYIGAKNG